MTDKESLEELIEAIKRACWYNGYEEYLEEIKNQIEQTPTNKYSYSYDYNDEGFQVVYMILVLLFGDYGTSPRFGWIEMKNKDKALAFIDKICYKSVFEE